MHTFLLSQACYMLLLTDCYLLLTTYSMLTRCLLGSLLFAPPSLCAHVFSLAGMRRRCCCPSVRGASAFLCRARLGAGSCLRRKRGRLEHHAAVESRWALGLTVQKCCRRCLLYGRLKTRKRARLLERHREHERSTDAFPSRSSRNTLQYSPSAA